MNTFDEIIQTKAFSDLTPEELEIVSELVSSEEEYNEMKSFFNGISQLAVSSREEVSGSVKSSLNSIFQAKHPGISQNWSAPSEAAPKKIIPVYSQNWFRVAALLVLSAGITTLWISFSENQVTDQDTTKTATASNTPQKPGQATGSGNSTKKEPFPMEAASPKEYTAVAEVAESQNTAEKEQNILSVPDNFSTGTYSVTASDKNRTAAPVTAGSTTYYQSFNQSAESSKEEDNPASFSKAGMDADLNPMGNGYSRAEDHANTGISTDDLLSLIEPSF